MTKAGYLKHKEVIDRYYTQLCGSDIWSKIGDSDFVLTSCPTWDVDCVYIINDEYSEFRKALYNGETVQYCDIRLDDDNQYRREWLDIDRSMYSPNSTWYYGAGSYRIKPKFGVGDWVVSDYVDQPYQIQAYKRYADAEYCNIRLWEPKIGEYVWVLDKVEGGHTTSPFIVKWSSLCTSYKVEPFIGELPSIYKS